MDKKQYHREQSKAWYKKNRERQLATVQKNTKNLAKRNRDFVLAYLDKSQCADCGEVDPIVLEFDHLENKAHNISKMIYSAWSLAKLKTEIEKCEVVCCNCHRRRTAHRAQWFKVTRQVRILPGALLCRSD